MHRCFIKTFENGDQWVAAILPVHVGARSHTGILWWFEAVKRGYHAEVA